MEVKAEALMVQVLSSVELLLEVDGKKTADNDVHRKNKG